jgi:hypothetical protein
MGSSTRRTAGCGPACPVVWQGRVGDHSPYADCYLIDPDTASGSSVNMGGVAGDGNSGPVRVAAEPR